jgi:hypothetical protein
MPFDSKLSFIIDHLRDLPDDMAEQGVEILLSAGETEYAAMLARDKGMTQKAIDILMAAGDYLWAGLMAKNAGMCEESDNIYREGLQYYLDMEMYGRAISAATALKLPPDEIDALFQKGVEVESRGMNLQATRDMIDCAMESLEISLLGRDDEISKQVKDAIVQERKRLSE